MKLNRCNRIYITKFRTGNNQLPVITGRYLQINREERYCTKCNERQIGDEFHMLQCQHKNVVELRNVYVPEYYIILRQNCFKFVELMQKKNTELLINLAQFIKDLLLLFG